MRKLVLFMHVSLDGYASDSNGGLDWIPYDEELEKYGEEVVAGVGAPVYGRTTYRMMESYCPQSWTIRMRRDTIWSMPDGCRMLRRSSFPARWTRWNGTIRC